MLRGESGAFAPMKWMENGTRGGECGSFSIYRVVLQRCSPHDHKGMKPNEYI